jgi:serine/threonine-protein kinase
VPQPKTSDEKVCPDCGAHFVLSETVCPHDGSILIASSEISDPLIGKTIDGKYRVGSKLGGGGFGAVYRAEHLMMGRTVALKVLHHHLLKTDNRNEFLVRFQREARTACQIDHPNAITIHDFGIFEDTPYLVMQYVEGQTLKQVIGQHGALALDRTVAIMEQVAAAVQEAHNAGIVHRDLKPDNVILTHAKDGSERAVVLDFGIAKLLSDDGNSLSSQLTQTGTITGTPQYLSPEQARQEEVSTCSDIYSLGVILYELLTGEVPFNADSVITTLVKHMNDQPPRFADLDKGLAIAPAIEAVVMKALEKSPASRQQSAGEFATELCEAAGIVPGTSISSASLPSQVIEIEKTPSVRIELNIPTRRNTYAILGALVLLVGGGAYALLASEEKVAEPQIEVPVVAKPKLVPALTSESYKETLALAEKERAQKNWLKAAAHYSAALKFKSDDPEVYFKHGDVLISAGKLKEAAESLEFAVKLDPNVEKFHANMGYVYGELGDLEASLAAYKDALRLSPKKPLLHNNVGFTYFNMKKYAEAERAYKKCIRTDRTFSRCFYNLGDVYRAQNKLNKVVAIYKIVLQLEPNNAAARNNLGETYQALGRKNNAKSEYRKAIKIDPTFARAQKNLRSLEGLQVVGVRPQ